MKKIKFLLTGEGPTDYGWRDNRTLSWEDGSAAHLIRKCAEKLNCQVELDYAEKQDVERIRLGRSIKGLSGKAVPARKFYRYMKEHRYAYGIYYCDADRESGKNNNEKQAKKRFDAVYKDVDMGANLDRNRREVIPMIALRMIESWLLADCEAYEKVYGEKAVKKAGISLPVKPEFIWGDSQDPQSNYPKNYLIRLCGQLSKYKQIPINRKLYASLAENVNIDKLQERCPISFGRFSEDFADFIEKR